MKLLILFIAFLFSTQSLVCKSQIRTSQPVGSIQTQPTKCGEASSVNTSEQTTLVIYRSGV